MKYLHTITLIWRISGGMCMSVCTFTSNVDIISFIKWGYILLPTFTFLMTETFHCALFRTYYYCYISELREVLSWTPIRFSYWSSRCKHSKHRSVRIPILITITCWLCVYLVTHVHTLHQHVIWHMQLLFQEVLFSLSLSLMIMIATTKWLTQLKRQSLVRVVVQFSIARISNELGGQKKV